MPMVQNGAPAAAAQVQVRRLSPPTVDAKNMSTPVNPDFSAQTKSFA
ncbi:MAG: hypothetical protein M3478_04545 [Planctomycetota bacterium]|nr:hypothetical protein [Planctomycetota bacterium]